MATTNKGQARYLWILSVFAIGLLTACGGGGGDSGSPGTVTVEILATETGVTDGATLSTAADRHIVGDDASNADYRGLIRIPLNTIPPGSNIVGAFINISFLQRIGTPAGNQLNNLGHMQFIRIDGSTPLAAGDYLAPQLALDPANNLIIDFPNLRPRIGLLQPLLSAVAAGDTHLKIRVQYQTATNGNSIADLMEFASLTHASQEGPLLEVIIQP
ncbi:MAG: hypothetical protein GY946_02880 [bacterium]|nr:hypothetical protein [bacterium]